VANRLIAWEVSLIFLSYAREDGERASKIFSLISRPDRPVFYDKDALIPGMDWRHEIEEKVRQCSLILILCSARSISKEGFVQKEIRLALDRAEEMPDGRIFIIPVRFDGVKIPTKLTKYHWLDINDDADLIDVQYFVDLAWDRLTGTPQSEIEQPPLLGMDRSLLRERVVILLGGRNLEGKQIYSYVRLPIWKLQDLRKTMRAKADFSAADYGVVLEKGEGEPSPELAARMAREYNMIDVPSGTEAQPATERQLQEVFEIVFAETYRSLLGENTPVPPAQLEFPIPAGSNVVREAVRHALVAARSRPEGDEPPPEPLVAPSNAAET
jgi:hypothetical protein